MTMNEIDRWLDACVELFKDDPAMRQLIREWKINKDFEQHYDEIETLQVLVLGIIGVLAMHKMLKPYGREKA